MTTRNDFYRVIGYAVFEQEIFVCLDERHKDPYNLRDYIFSDLEIDLDSKHINFVARIFERAKSQLETIRGLVLANNEIRQHYQSNPIAIATGVGGMITDSKLSFWLSRNRAEAKWFLRRSLGVTDADTLQSFYHLIKDARGLLDAIDSLDMAGWKRISINLALEGQLPLLVVEKENESITSVNLLLPRGTCDWSVSRGYPKDESDTPVALTEEEQSSLASSLENLTCFRTQKENALLVRSYLASFSGR